MSLRIFVRAFLPAPSVGHADPPGEGVRVLSVVNDEHAVYYAVFLHSLLRHNPWFRVPIRILHGAESSPLSGDMMRRLNLLYSSMEFVEVDERRYAKKFARTPRHMWAAWLKLECFGMDGADDLVCLDADMVCLGDVAELFAARVPFGVVPAGKDRLLKEEVAGDFQRRIGFNTGVMMVGQPYRNARVYRRLLRHGGGGVLADQMLLNRVFRHVPVYCIHPRYNYHSEFFWDEYGHADDVRILHYAGAKPMQEPGLPRMRPWFEAARELLREHPEWADEIRLPAENVEHGGLNS